MHFTSQQTRREFLRLSATVGFSLALRSRVWAGQTHDTIPRRVLGHTGEKVSMIGLGGFHIGSQRDAQESIRIIRAAVDGGINFLDNCWDYNDGESEKRMGMALRDGYRKKVFLMTKIDGRTKKSAADQIDQSLQRLQTDHIDLVQFHEVIRMEDPERIFAEGAMDAVQEAKKAGKIRYIGFTGHKDPAIHLYMLAIARRHHFKFDTVQMPLNVMDAHFRSFGKQVVPELVKEGIGVLGMKPLASGAALKSGAVTPVECWHYALSLPTSVVITGLDQMKYLDEALEAVRTFKPLDETKIAALLAKTREHALSGKFERFKTANDFDATAQNPAWIG
jgi:aryl-alcohol dehydrogenase-like predicted oxidoreductase